MAQRHVVNKCLWRNSWDRLTRREAPTDLPFVQNAAKPSAVKGGMCVWSTWAERGGQVSQHDGETLWELQLLHVEPNVFLPFQERAAVSPAVSTRKAAAGRLLFYALTLGLRSHWAEACQCFHSFWLILHIT